MVVDAPSNDQRGYRHIKNSPGDIYHAIGHNKDLPCLSNWNDTKKIRIAEKETELLPWRSLELSKHSNSII